MTTAIPPAGWYDDPDATGQLRWWDGSAWTERRAEMPHAPTGAVRPAGVTRATAPAGSSRVARRRPTAAADAVATTEVLATAWERLAAVVLDGVLALVLLLLLSMMNLAFSVLPDPMATALAALVILTAWALPAISQIMGTGRLGQSYGKHLMGIAVVSTQTGRPIGSPAAFGRAVVQSIGMHVFGLGVLWILWDPQRQGWHDKAVSSIVVRTSAAPRLDPVAYLRAIFAAR
jgi:uncharacterized RDD family membrane protein YckC